MKAEKLIEKLNMMPQEEGGMVMPTNCETEGAERAPSVHAYYYFKPHTPTLFHTIDCDEYWIYNAGSDLEVWSISKDGQLKVQKLGASEEAELCLFFEKGVAMASRPAGMNDEGTLVSLVTVPSYSQDGLCLLSEEEVIRMCPEAEKFFRYE